MIRRPPRSTHCISSAASDVYKRQENDRSIKNSSLATGLSVAFCAIALTITGCSSVLLAPLSDFISRTSFLVSESSGYSFRGCMYDGLLEDGVVLLVAAVYVGE
eukprot:TRINITY_DN16278_c0_g1_i1.p4 TRINITY_DN16278_c0_g1~~TRINITY_DN16278_c0_g1_i1.p4  ORF type:complete len:112 (+),score=23.16 TRINITY_DN16278_c0_g1_i1:25-336(+)